jgi:hypothetical protein
MRTYRYSIIAIIAVLVFVVAGTALARGERRAEMAEKFRNRVQEIAQELREVAGKDQNIGEEISEVAKGQGEIAEEDGDSMEAVEKRGKFRSFLFGTDYRNIGKIRRNMVRSRNHISRLESTKERATSDDVKDTIDEKIVDLEQIQTDTESFIQEHEDKFSLFGWLMKRIRGGEESE